MDERATIFDDGQDRSPISLPPHTLLCDQYEIGRLLGKPGGFGITYLAWDDLLHMRVAIKEYMPRDMAGRQPGNTTIVPHSGEDAEYFQYGLDQFLDEARRLAKFDHANIVRIRHFFRANGTAYIVMPYYEGLTLTQYLDQQGGTLPPDLAVRLMLPVLDGLREVHNKGFLHRDIKPHNIYLTRQGRPILLDFGAARQAVGARSRSLTSVLTEGYAPYEQYTTRGDQGPWTDVYACAGTLYTALTGQVPVPATDRMLGDEMKPPHRLNKAVPEALSLVVMQGMAVKPADRPQTARVFQDWLLAPEATLRNNFGTPVAGELVEVDSKVPEVAEDVEEELAEQETGTAPPAAEEAPTLPAIDPDAPARRKKSKAPLVLASLLALAAVGAVGYLWLYPLLFPDPVIVATNNRFDSLRTAVQRNLQAEDLVRAEATLQVFDQFCQGDARWNESLDDRCSEQVRLLSQEATTLAQRLGVRSVAADGSAAYRTIGAALEGAQPGTLIRIQPGTYEEAITLTTPVKLVAMDGEVTLTHTAETVLTLETDSATVQGLTLVGGYTGEEPTTKKFVVEINRGHLRLVDAVVSHGTLTNIAVQGPTGTLTLENSRSYGSYESAVFVLGGGTATIRNSDLYDSRLANLFIRDAGSRVDMARGSLRNSEQPGATLRDGAQAVFSDVEISGNGLSGIVARGAGTRVQVNGGKIYDGKSSGLYFHEQAQLTMRNTEVYSNSNSNIHLRTGAQADIENIRVYDGQKTGLYIVEGGQAQVRRSHIFNNAFAGVEVKDANSQLTLEGGRVYQGQAGGLFVHNQATVRVSGTEFANNHLSGIEVKTGAHPQFTNVRIHNNEQAGVYVHENGAITISDSEVTGNTGTGFYLREAQPLIQRVQITNNGQYGVTALNGTQGTVEFSTISGNTSGGWNVDEGSYIQQRGNRSS